MIERSNMPLLPGEKERPTETVNVNELNTLGVSGSAFAVHTGDKIEFDTDDALVVSQPVRRDDPKSPKAYYVAVRRNGEPSWLSISALTRRDGHGKPLGKFQEKMLTYPSFKQVYDTLRGKTITGGELKQFDFAEFVNGDRTGNFIQRMVAEIICNEI